MATIKKRKKNRFWSKVEVAILKEHLHYTPRKLQRLFFPKRTREEITVKKYRIRKILGLLGDGD